MAAGWEDVPILDLGDARTPVEGRDLEVVASISSAPSGGSRRLADLGSLLPTGQILVRDMAASEGLTLTPEQPALLEPTGGEQPLAVLPDDGVVRQAPYTDTDGHTMVWMETTSIDLITLDWRIVAAGLDGSPARLVADWADYTDDPPPLIAAEVQPSAGHGWIAWNAPLPSIGDGWRGLGFDQRIFVAADDDVTVLERPAAVHASGGKDLYLARDSTIDPSVPEGRYQIVRISPTGGLAEEVLAEGDLPPPEGRVSDVAADGSAFAWAISGGSGSGTSTVHLSDGERRVVIVAPDAGTSSRLSLSAGRLAWGEGSAGGDGGAYLLDRDDTVWRLASSPGLSDAAVTGDWIAWPTVSDEGPWGITHLARWLR